MRRITDIVVHCAATPDGEPFTIEDIAAMHMGPPNNWRRIGYHYVIELDGARMTGVPLEEPGAHVKGSNAHSIGVCLIGTARFTPEQWDELAALVGELEARFPGATVSGHRDFSPDLNGDGVIDPHEWFKLCPGFDVRAWRLGGMNALWNPAHLLP